MSLVCECCGRPATWSAGVFGGVERLRCVRCKDREKRKMEMFHRGKPVATRRTYRRILKGMTPEYKAKVLTDSSIDDMQAANTLGISIQAVYASRRRLGALTYTPRSHGQTWDDLEIRQKLTHHLMDEDGLINLSRFRRLAKVSRDRLIYRIESTETPRRISRSKTLREHILKNGLPKSGAEVEELGITFNLGRTTLYKTIREVALELAEQNDESKHDDLM